MNRRDFLFVGGGCCACLLPRLGQTQSDWQPPERFVRPDLSTDEGGLWSLMDREETKLRRSPLSIRDSKLHSYVQGIACKLAEGHCPDIRVHLVRVPYFNASMAPNGMMQVWTGLMLRVENEAQLAAILGHEIGHYLARHQLDQLRDSKSRSAFGQFLGMFGVVGAIGQLGLLAGMFEYSRDHEREADHIGATLMRRAGYDPAESAKIWGNLLLEAKANPEGHGSSLLFATHPPAEERQAALTKLAIANPGGVANETQWQERIEPFLGGWLNDEIKRGQHEESIALFTRMITHTPSRPQFRYARGEVYRLRAKEGDLEAAVVDFKAAALLGREPPETHRGLGMIYRARKQSLEARESLQRYLKLAPDAPDFSMIKSYVEELRT